ncbi:MAG: ABC transporter permease subunit, partial [Candidatus Promineifilaceae bacterium]
MTSDSTLARNDTSPAVLASAIPEAVDGGDQPGRITRRRGMGGGAGGGAGALSSIWSGLFNLVAFLGPRSLFGILVLLFIIWLSFLGINMAGGMTVGEAAVSAFPATVDYVARLLHGDLGMTGIASGSLIAVPVQEVIAVLLPRSFALLGLSVLLATITGLILGIRAAASGGKRSLGVLVATIIGISIPSFFAAFLLQFLVIQITQTAGRAILPAGGFGWDTHLILPVLVLAARPLAQITRITFVSVGEVRSEDYVRTAKSKGLRNYQVTFRHVLRNAAIPILTTIGVSVRFALASLPIVESFFGWPGAGAALLKGIAQQDSNLVVALFLCFGLFFIVLNILLELSYRLIDPRLWRKPAYISSKSRSTPKEFLQSAVEYGQEILHNNPITDLFKQLREMGSSFRAKSVEQKDSVDDLESEELLRPSRKIGWEAAIRNFPFMFGGILVVLIVVIILFGPNLSPNSPYHTQGLVMVDGQLTSPPFAPSEEYPFGTDALGRGILSLLLAGAQQTLVLGILVVGARLLVGVLLGAIAGWTNGSWADRLIMGTSEALA